MGTINWVTLLLCVGLIGAALGNWPRYLKDEAAMENKRKAQAKQQGKKRRKQRTGGTRPQNQAKAQTKQAAQSHEKYVEEKKKKQIEWGIFAGLMLLAFVLRAWQFGNIPGGMNQDGAMAAVDAKALADHATDRYGMFMPVHFTAWGYGQMSVLLSYLMVPFIKLFGLSAVTARMPMLLVSMCGMAALYFLFKRLFGLRAAQIILAFLVVNPWHFMQSRWALDCNMFPHMFVLGLFFMLWGIAEKKRYLYLSMLFYALCMYSYGISFYTVPVFLLAACIYMLVKKVIQLKDAGICIGVYVLVAWPIYTSMVINTLRLKTIKTPFFTIPFFPDSVRSQDILFFADNKWEQFQSNVKSMFSVILHGDTLPWNTIEGYGTIYICFLPFILLGIYLVIHMFRKEENPVKKTGLICLLFFFGTGILAGLITANVNVNRINIIMYPMIIFAALGIYFVYLNKQKLAYVILPLYLFLGAMFIHSYFTSFAENIRYTFFEGFIDSVQDLEEHSDCQIYCITPDSQYEGASNVSEILTLYALQIDAEYYQGKEDGGEPPYQEKFYYCNASATDVNAENGFAYVISNRELYLFSGDEWHIETHDNFSSVIPAQNYKGS